MGHVYIARHGQENLFQIGHTPYSVAKALERLQIGLSSRLCIFECIDTDESIAMAVFLRHALRSGVRTLANGKECYEVSEPEMKTALKKARTYLDDFVAAKIEVKNLAMVESDRRVELPTPGDLTVYQRLCEVRDDQDRLAVQREYCESRLKARIGSASELKGVAVWKSESRQRFDLPAFKFAEPAQYEALYDRFGATMQIRYFKLQRSA